MTKNYKVNVQFKTVIKQDDEITRFDLSAQGTLVRSTNLEKIYFQSQHDGQPYQLEVTIFESKVIKIKQIKPNQSNLEFDPSKKTFANYTTEYGSLDLQIKTNKLVYRPGVLVIEYLIENTSAENAYYSIELNYKEIN
jgi:uncharacterized beta-barrel protein YwiB (DUF1934 family)